MADSTLGVPKGFRSYSPYPFGGINLQASPLAIGDQEFYYLENFVLTGEGYLRTVWDVGASLYDAPSPDKAIVSFNFYTIGSNYYAIVFRANGSALQVAAPPTGSGATTTVSATAGTFYLSSSGYVPAVTQWGDQFIVITNRNTPNDYWVWDGSILYGAGTLAPTSATNPVLLSGGSGYNSAPNVTVFGGLGSGAQVTASVQDGAVVNLQITNPGSGYGPGDVVQAQFSGGGSDTGAILTASISAGGVSAIEVTAPGTGYASAPTVVIGGGGQVTSVAVTAGGSYTATPTVAFTGGGGTGATGVAHLAFTQVVSVTITSPGSGYTSAPTVAFTGGGGSGAAATATVSGGAAATATESGGVVTGVTVTNPGSGYAVAPPVSFTGGGGSGATAVAQLAAAGVRSVSVVNAGSGYFQAPLLELVGGGGAGATAGVRLTPTSVAQVNVTASGSGYTGPVTVVFTSADGNGSGASAVASLDGGVAAVTLTSGGSGYTLPPIMSFTGGGGAGAGAAALLVPTSIASAYVSNSGTGYTTAPAVEVLAGSNNAAAATLDLMPFGVSGSAPETYNSRVWLANPAPPQFGSLPPGGNFSYSAAESFTDYATSDGGGEFTNSDRFLQTTYVGMRQSNGYLYALGDGSVAVISNVQTTGSPPTTTFTYQNVDPQSGLSWRDSMQDYGRAVVFGNLTGVYGLYGGNVAKVSDKLDRLFVNALFPPAAGAATPSSAVATIYDVKHYLMLLTILDPDTGAARNVMVAWNEKIWTVLSQSVSFTFVGAQKVSSRFTAWGTDGVGLYPMFQAPSSSLTKRLDTKIYGSDSPFLIKDLLSLHLVVQDLSAAQAGVAGSVTFTMSGPAQQEPGYPSALSGVYQNVLIGMLQVSAPPPAWPTWTSGTQGLPFNLLGMRFTTTSPDFVVGNIVLGYVPIGFTN